MSEDDERYFGRNVSSIELEALLVNIKAASSILEVCERYGISRQTLYNEINRGSLRVRKIGKRSIVLPQDEQAWLDSLESLAAHSLVHGRKPAMRRYGRTPTNKQDGKRVRAQSVK